MKILDWLRGWIDLEKATLDEAVASHARYAHGRLLDVGCGNKPYESLFLPHVAEYVGIELDSTYHGSANERAGKADYVYDGSHFEFPDESFDTVLCTQVLEHTSDADALLRECSRVLRQQGTLLVTVPFSFRIHSAPHDYLRYTRFGITELLTRSGYLVRDLCTRGGFWFVIGQKLASHLVLRGARMGRTVQAAGSLTYEPEIQASPRYWAIPFVAPAVIAIVLLARALERLDPDDSDSLGYLVVATKATPSGTCRSPSADG